MFIAGQVRYQLTLLLRSPIASFVTLVIPLMLLIALNLVTPEMTLASLGGVHVVQFITPAMAAFAVLNAGFVNTIVGTTLAREAGVLKRLHGTPLPEWAYVAGRLGASIVLAACSVVIVMGSGVVFFHAHVALGSLPLFVESAGAGLAVSFALGVALAGMVRSSDTALPLAYAVLLPCAFISGVFYPAPNEAHWLHGLASALPVEPFARAMEASFRNGTGATAHDFVVLGSWLLGALAACLATFRWQSRKVPAPRHDTHRHRIRPADVPGRRSS